MVPSLLLAFFAATLAMVGAIVVIGRSGSDLADAGAVALLVALVAVMGTMIARELRDRGS